MTIPIRLSDDGGGADELERAILRSDLEVEPPDGANVAVWARLSSQLGVTGALAGVATVEAAKSAVKLKLAGSGGGATVGASVGTLAAAPAVGGWLTFVKGVLVGLLASGAIWQGQRLLSAPTPTPAPSVSASAASRTSAIGEAAGPAPATPTLEPRPAPPLRGESGSAPTRGAAPERLQVGSPPASAPSAAAFVDENDVVRDTRQLASQLKEEARMLRQARAQLRAGAFASALALLDASQRRFASPELYQERESLMIELLFRSGQTAVASQRAKNFLAMFPESPHAARLREFGRP